MVFKGSLEVPSSYRISHYKKPRQSQLPAAQARESRGEASRKSEDQNRLQQSLSGSCVKNEPNPGFLVGMMKKFWQWMVVMIA